MKVVISGSFRKHMTEIIELKQRLEKDGVEVVKPDNIDVIDNPENPEFVKFKGEENVSEEDLQAQYFHGIERCDAHIIYNKDGYIGSSALYELFYGAGTNSFVEKNNYKCTQVYLLEPLNFEQIRSAHGNNISNDFQRIHLMLSALIEMGRVKVGLEVMYQDFDIGEERKYK